MTKGRVKKKILFVGYDRNLAILQGGALQKLANYEVCAADSAEWGRQLFSTESFDVVVLGPGLSAEERQLLAVDVRRNNSATKIVILPEAVLPVQLARLLGA